jgi:hypothetical protein
VRPSEGDEVGPSPEAPPYLVQLGRFAERCTLDPVVEVAIDRVANAIAALAGGRYTAKDRKWPQWAFWILRDAGYLLDAGEIFVWLRADGRVCHGLDELVALVDERRRPDPGGRPWKNDILEQWRAVAFASLSK